MPFLSTLDIIHKMSSSEELFWLDSHYNTVFNNSGHDASCSILNEDFYTARCVLGTLNGRYSDPINEEHLCSNSGVH